MKYELKPSGLYRFFGAKPKTVVKEGKAAYLVGESGQRDEILTDSLKKNFGVRRSLIGQKLVLSTSNGKRTISGLKSSVAHDAYSSVSSLFYKNLHSEIQPISRALKSQLEGSYIRTSQLLLAKAHAQAALLKFYAPPKPGLLPKDLEQDYRWIENVAKIDKKGIEKLRTAHIQKHLKKFESFFEAVEKDPLTERQRIACITDEDNNLVIAGAGTGKTSTMVGRAGYLVKSGLAKPEEILLLAYANKAAGELKERIQDRLGIDGIQVETFHSLGQKIVAHAENGKPTITSLVESQGDKRRPQKLERWVSAEFQKNLGTPAYRRMVLKYFAELYYTPPREEELKSEGDQLRYLVDNNVVTFKGEPVKSYGEVLVANFLFRNGIQYEYEREYEHTTSTIEHRQYRPDFYLTDYGIYIEYWGTSRDGSTAPWINKEKYAEGMAWKRLIHERFGTHLVDAYHYERIEGKLFKNLKARLESLGVEFRQLSQLQFLEHLSKSQDGSQKSPVNEFVGLLTDLLLRIRETGYTEEQLLEKAKASFYPAQMKAVLEIVRPIVRSYLVHLEAESCIDFDHMIHRARKYVLSDIYSPGWRYLLIDEFQDISRPRAELVKAIRAKSSNCSIFAVGDDWQAIYRFTGSDISFTSHFEENFGASQKNFLDTTFRFNDQLSAVASSFIQKNPSQLKKELKTLSKSETPTVAVLIQEQPPGNENLNPILDHISNLSTNYADVLILSRFKFYLPENVRLAKWRQEYPKLSIEKMSIHASKGKQADYVILVGAVSGAHGLPSEKRTHPMLEALLPEAETYPHAEERRLFYVAITRAKNRTYIVSQSSAVSDFVTELDKGGYPLDRDTFPKSEQDIHRQSTPCPACATGKLTARQNAATKETFYGCTFYPRCRGTASACKSCGLPMTGESYARKCVDSKCISNSN